MSDVSATFLGATDHWCCICVYELYTQQILFTDCPLSVESLRKKFLLLIASGHRMVICVFDACYDQLFVFGGSDLT